MAKLLDMAGSQALRDLGNAPSLSVLEKQAAEQLVESTLNNVKKRISAWLLENQNFVLFKKKILFWSITIKVKDIVKIIDAMLEETTPESLDA